MFSAGVSAGVVSIISALGGVLCVGAGVSKSSLGGELCAGVGKSSLVSCISAGGVPGFWREKTG